MVRKHSHSYYRYVQGLTNHELVPLPFDCPRVRRGTDYVTTLLFVVGVCVCARVRARACVCACVCVCGRGASACRVFTVLLSAKQTGPGESAGVPTM